MIREPLESLGDSITSAVLLSWSKKPGDNIKEDDVICIVETDKVTMDIRAKRSGVFVESLTTEGAEVQTSLLTPLLLLITCMLQLDQCWKRFICY